LKNINKYWTESCWKTANNFSWSCSSNVAGFIYTGHWPVQIGIPSCPRANKNPVII